MRSTYLIPSLQAEQIKKIGDILLTVLLFSLVILLLCYFFHKGAVMATEIAMNKALPVAW